MELLPDTMPVISASTGLLNSDTLKTKLKAELRKLARVNEIYLHSSLLTSSVSFDGATSFNAKLSNVCSN